MKNLYYFLIGLLLSLVLTVPFARAETINATVNSSYSITYTDPAYIYNPAGTCTGSSPGVVFSCWVSKWPKNGGSDTAFLDSSSLSGLTITATYHWQYAAGGATQYFSGAITDSSTYSCPSTGGWTRSGSTCSRNDCAAGYQHDSVSGACVQGCPSGEHWDSAAGTCFYDSCPVGKVLDSGWYSDTNNDGLPTSESCYKGCKGVYSGSKDANYAYWGGYTSQKGFLGSYKADGTTGTCQAASKTAPATETDSQKNQTALGCLQKNQSFAVDGSGAVVCVPVGTSGVVPVTSSDTKVATAADGTRTESTTQTDVNSDGSVTETTTTKTYNSSGSLTGTAVTSQKSSLDGFCKSNPNANICGEGGTSSGGELCTNPPVCSGDPINCAIQFQTWKTRCEVEKQNTNISEAEAWADEQLSTGDPASPFADSEKTLVNVGVFDTTDMLGNASCPAPKSFTVLGRTYQIPFDVFCNIATIIGHILVIGASILSLRLVMGAL